MDGIEDGLDKWLAGLWPALKKAAAPEGAAEAAPAAGAAPAAEGSTAAVDSELQGVPPLPRCRVRLAWQGDTGAAAAVRAAEAGAPSAADLARRDPAGEYSAEAPFWAPVTHARYLTTELSGSDRQVCWGGVEWGGLGCIHTCVPVVQHAGPPQLTTRARRGALLPHAPRRCQLSVPCAARHAPHVQAPPPLHFRELSPVPPPLSPLPPASQFNKLPLCRNPDPGPIAPLARTGAAP